MRYLPDFPYGLDLKPQFFPAIAHDLAHGLLQVPLAGAEQQHIVHVTQVVRNIGNPLATAQLVQVLHHMVVQVLQIEVGEPLVGVRPYGQALRHAADHLIDHVQNALILDHPAELRLEEFLIDARIEFPDIQLDEVFAPVVMLHPALHRAPDTGDSAPGNAPVAVLVHAPGHGLLDGQNEHPVNDVIVQGRTVDVPPLSTGGNDDLLLRWRVLPAILQPVDDTPGVTRDRIYGECEWLNRKISLIDTGGIEFAKSDDSMAGEIRKQAEIAMDVAYVIVFVVDLKSGVVASDIEIAHMLQKSGKPVVLCVNKADNIGNDDYSFYEFYNLGLGEPVKVSSVHGHGTGDLLDEIFKYLPHEESESDEELTSVAIIGKPNVGKSSLINYISGYERSIVSNVAGTTRNTIDTKITNDYGNYKFIDTAGIRRRSKIVDDVEKYSVIRAKLAVERSDVCLIMIDAQEGATEQDTKIAGLAHEAGKACIIVVNKWDAIEKDDKTMDEFKKDLKEIFLFMSYAPIVFISAKTGQRVNSLYEYINNVRNANSMRISTGILNDVLSEAITRTPTPTHKGKKLKIYYMTQASVCPPTFIFFVNKADLFHFSYKHYLENTIRKIFGFEGTPIRFVVREKSEKNVEPKF